MQVVAVVAALLVVAKVATSGVGDGMRRWSSLASSPRAAVIDTFAGSTATAASPFQHTTSSRNVTRVVNTVTAPIAYYYKCTLKSSACTTMAEQFNGDIKQLVLLFDAPTDANASLRRSDLATRVPNVQAVFDPATNDFGMYKTFGYYSVEHKTKGL